MKDRKWRIAMDVPMYVQNTYPHRVPRRHPWVYGRSITWAYGVDEDFAFDGEEQKCSLYALHTNTAFQSFAATIGEHTHRPDGRILHLTYCTEEGIKPADTGLFDVGDTKPLPKPMLFRGRLTRFPLWNQKPTFMALRSSR